MKILFKKSLSKVLILTLSWIVLMSTIGPITCAPVFAEVFEAYTYSLSGDGTATITGYDAEIGGITPTIPSTIEGHLVTDIGFQAFKGKDLRSITLPEGLLRIGAYSFEGNSLESLMVPDSVVSIGDGAFYKTQLKSLTLGKGLLSIGSDAFSSNQITSVTLLPNISSLGDNVFKFNGPNSDSESIGDWVSGVGGLWHLEHLNWVKSPYMYTLSGDGTATITGYDAEIGGIRPTIPSTIEGHLVTDIGFQAFKGKDLRSITLPEGLLRIGAYSFEGNSLESLMVPDSVVSIGDGAFYKTQLKSLTLGRGLLSIGGDAFSSNLLTSVTLPPNISSLGENVFKFNGPNSDSESIGDWVSGVGGIWHLEHLNWVKSPYMYTLSGDGTATITGYDAEIGGITPTIPATIEGHLVTDIGFQAFMKKDLRSITLPEGLLRIGAYSFEGNSLESLMVPYSVVSIGDGAFYKTQLKSLTLGRGLLSIGSDAFSSNQLTSVTLPPNISSLGENVFKFNGPNSDSESIGDWVSGVGGIWHLVEGTWVKECLVPINEEQAAPVGLSTLAPTALLTDGKILGTSLMMEFKLESETEYTDVTATNTLNLSSGIYHVRFKAKLGFHAGAVAAIIIPPYVNLEMPLTIIPSKPFTPIEETPIEMEPELALDPSLNILITGQEEKTAIQLPSVLNDIESIHSNADDKRVDEKSMGEASVLMDRVNEGLLDKRVAAVTVISRDTVKSKKIFKEDSNQVILSRRLNNAFSSNPIREPESDEIEKKVILKAQPLKVEPAADILDPSENDYDKGLNGMLIVILFAVSSVGGAATIIFLKSK